MKKVLQNLYFESGFKTKTRKQMSVEVEEFDVKKAERELKACPKIVQDYVEQIKRHSENWRNIATLAQIELRQY